MTEKLTSDVRRVANQDNAKSSTGPKSRAGKSRSSRNALRHGLNVSIWGDPSLGPEVEEIGLRIAGNKASKAKLDLARRIGAAQVDINRIRKIRLNLIAELVSNFCLQRDIETLDSMELESARELASELSEKASAITRLDRYERRALSLRKSAIRQFDALSRQ